MKEYLKSFLSLDSGFYLDEDKEYSNRELIEILKTKSLALGTGNAIILCLIDRLDKKINGDVN